jgi:hypothetical protein
LLHKGTNVVLQIACLAHPGTVRSHNPQPPPGRRPTSFDFSTAKPRGKLQNIFKFFGFYDKD